MQAAENIRTLVYRLSTARHLNMDAFASWDGSLGGSPLAVLGVIRTAAGFVSVLRPSQPGLTILLVGSFSRFVCLGAFSAYPAGRTGFASVTSSYLVSGFAGGVVSKRGF
jgi:hypothetical protein